MSQARPDGDGPLPPEYPVYVSDRWIRIRAEVERNRGGGHRVPTWALAVVLAVVVAALVLLAVLARR